MIFFPVNIYKSWALSLFGEHTVRQATRLLTSLLVNFSSKFRLFPAPKKTNLSTYFEKYLLWAPGPNGQKRLERSGVLLFQLSLWSDPDGSEAGRKKPEINEPETNVSTDGMHHGINSILLSGQ